MSEVSIFAMKASVNGWIGSGRCSREDPHKASLVHAPTYAVKKASRRRFFVKVNGVWFYLRRVADHESEVLESYVAKTLDNQVAPSFLKRAMKRHGNLQGDPDQPYLIMQCRNESYWQLGQHRKTSAATRFSRTPSNACELSRPEPSTRLAFYKCWSARNAIYLLGSYLGLPPQMQTLL